MNVIVQILEYLLSILLLGYNLGIGRPGVLQSMGLQRVGRDLVTEQQQNIHPTGQAQFPTPTASAVHVPDITSQQQHYELRDFPGGSADTEFT